MWEFALDLVTSAVTSAFGWFSDLLNAAPGAWNTIFTVFVILAICRFLLAPVLGVTFGGKGSDRVKKPKGDKDG